MRRNTLSSVGAGALSLFLGVAPAAAAETYYVSPSGNDKASGLSSSAPFETIQRAANVAGPGDTVLVMNGTYTNASPNGYVVELKRAGTADAWITFKAHPGHTPKIKFNGWAGFRVTPGGRYIEINGFEVEGNNQNVTLAYAQSQKFNRNNPLTNGSCIDVIGRGGTKSTKPHHIRILNNKAHDCGGGISAIEADYISIVGNEVYNNSWYTVHGSSGISILTPFDSDSSTGYKMLILNNKVYNNRLYIPWIKAGKITDGNGIIIDTTGKYKGKTLVANNVVFKNGGSGIHAFKASNVDILHNTAYKNSQSPELLLGEIFSQVSKNVRILNNILYADAANRINTNQKNVKLVADYNILFKDPNPAMKDGGISVKGPHDIIADPKFLNPSLDPRDADFRLSPSSPAVDSGVQLQEVIDALDGTLRPVGGGTDRGAYEIAGTTPPNPPPNSTERVVAFSNSDYTGASKSFAVGLYWAKRGELAGIGNDTISSLIVPAGMSVKICIHESAGTCRILAAGKHSLARTSLDNRVSSLEVTRTE